MSKENSLTVQETYYAAIDTYGKRNQLIVAMEEMSELTKELSKNMRGQNNISAISEEMADVEIMLEQLKIIFGNTVDVSLCRMKKLKRLADRIHSETRGGVCPEE